MNKQEFLAELQSALNGLPNEDIEERLIFYGEMIDDRIEEGKTEEEAVAEIGPVGDIVSQIVSDIPLTKIVKERIKPKRTMRAWEIVLIVVGFPIWFSLGIAAVAVVFSLYVVLWSLIIALWAIEISFWAGAAGGIVVATLLFTQGALQHGLIFIGSSLFLAGLSIFLFYGCLAASKGMVTLTKKIALGIKSMFIKKGE